MRLRIDAWLDERTRGQSGYDGPMPNIAVVLKGEIARLARKETRSEVAELRKASSQYRAHIAALRRRIEAMERQLKRLSKAGGRAKAAAAEPAGEETTQRRFSAKRFAAHRAKLGLSAADYGKLIGVTGQTVYKWESGKARPRSGQLESIAAVRGIGKREAAAKLAAA